MIRTAIVATALMAFAPSAGAAGFCNACGCKGGSGYRAPDGKCMGKRNLTKVCGSLPSSRCTFEGKDAMRNETPNPTHHPKVINPFAEG